MELSLEVDPFGNLRDVTVWEGAVGVEVVTALLETRWRPWKPINIVIFVILNECNVKQYIFVKKDFKKLLHSGLGWYEIVEDNLDEKGCKDQNDFQVLYICM
jgi:hypothetical protein